MLYEIINFIPLLLKPLKNTASKNLDGICLVGGGTNWFSERKMESAKCNLENNKLFPHFMNALYINVRNYILFHAIKDEGLKQIYNWNNLTEYIEEFLYPELKKRKVY